MAFYDAMNTLRGKDQIIVNAPNSSNQRPPNKRRRSNNRRRRPQGSQGPQGPQGPNENQGGQSASSRSGRRRRRGNGPRLSAIDRLIVKVENLRLAHLEARRKYFELFDRADPRQKDKLERQFTQSMKTLRDFESSLTEQDRALFERHYDAYPPDLTYATNHELPSAGGGVSFEGEFEDPHELESQKQANYAQDTEESIGSLDDYKAYKGL
jgi:hypothetical protein